MQNSQLLKHTSGLEIVANENGTYKIVTSSNQSFQHELHGDLSVHEC